MFTLIFFSLTNLFNYYYVFLIEIKRCNLNIQAFIFMLNNFEYTNLNVIGMKAMNGYGTFPDPLPFQQYKI